MIGIFHVLVQIKTVSSTYIFMGQYKKYNPSLSLDATIMVSRKLLNHSSKKIWVQSFLKVASYYAHLKKFIIRKNTDSAVFELYAPKAETKGVFSRSYCCYGNLLHHKNDAMIVA